MLRIRLARAHGLAWLGVLLVTGPAGADVFRFQDENGVVHYTNAPTDPRYQRLLGWPEAPPPSGLSVAARLLGRFAPSIRAAADRYRVDPRLVEAVVVVESAGNPRAVSRKGAMGLMQLMPGRSALLGVRNPFDPLQNLDGGVRHLRDLLERFSGDVTLALAAYNAGEDAVRTHGGVPPFAETRDYVRKVRRFYDGLEGPGRRWTLNEAPQRIYRRVGPDGTVLYTNLPPNPSPTVRGRF